MATGTRNSKRNTRVTRPRSSALFGRFLMRRFYQQRKATAQIKGVIGGDLRSRIWFVAPVAHTLQRAKTRLVRIAESRCPAIMAARCHAHTAILFTRS
jgi:hypothetical protein